MKIYLICSSKNRCLNFLKRSSAFVRSGHDVDVVFYNVRNGRHWKLFSDHDRLVTLIEDIEQAKVFYRDCREGRNIFFRENFPKNGKFHHS